MLCAAALQWFSFFDVMDGVRARRQKSGSPLGRIIDEAGDCVMQSIYSLWLGYCFNFDWWLFEIIFLMTNVIFYAMEMKFVLCNNLVMIVGEVGPVEIELLLTMIVGLSGLWGVENYQKTIGESYNFGADSSFALVNDVQWKFVVGSIFLPL